MCAALTPSFHKTHPPHTHMQRCETFGEMSQRNVETYRLYGTALLAIVGLPLPPSSVRSLSGVIPLNWDCMCDTWGTHPCTWFPGRHPLPSLSLSLSPPPRPHLHPHPHPSLRIPSFSDNNASSHRCRPKPKVRWEAMVVVKKEVRVMVEGLLHGARGRVHWYCVFVDAIGSSTGCNATNTRVLQWHVSRAPTFLLFTVFVTLHR
jgi:hypothetical protein